VADIVDIDPVEVVVSVPERDVPFFSMGQTVEITADVKTCPQSYQGMITFISRVADERTRSTRMEITVANEDGCLHSGQIVQAHLTRRILENAILIPLLAVIPMENGYAVYVVETSSDSPERGKAERREVQLGIIKGDRIQVVKGLRPGDRLIVAGHRFVAPGQDVTVVSQAPEQGQ